MPKRRDPARRAQGPDADEGPSGPLVPWVFIHSPLEQWMYDYQRTFDAWEAGGVRGIVVGPAEIL